MALAKVRGHEKFPNLYWVLSEEGDWKLATLNMTPGRSVYGEKLIKYGKQEYRLWNPYRSKLAAAVYRGLEAFPVKSADKVLYLGAATGTTVSHVSDIAGPLGVVYCVDFSGRVVKDLLNNVCAYRHNTIPLLVDARYPEAYRMMVEKVDFIYCDIAQPEQAKILADNADMFLKTGGKALLIIKARSIDVTKEPSEVFKREIEALSKRGFTVTESINLEPYDRDHSLVVAETKR